MMLFERIMIGKKARLQLFSEHALFSITSYDKPTPTQCSNFWLEYWLVPKNTYHTF